MTLFWLPTGALIQYRHGVLYVENLNPEIRTKWAMSRTEMMRLGWNCIRAAVSGDRTEAKT